MINKPTVNVPEQKVLARQAILFVLAYVKAYKNLFGNYNGYRDRSVKKCFSMINDLLPKPLRNIDHLETTAIFNRDKYATYPEGYPTYGYGCYEPPFFIFPISERSAVQAFVNRFNINGFAKEMEALQKPIREWLIREEMTRARKAIVLLKARTRLSSFGKKYPELKRALEKL